MTDQHRATPNQWAQVNEWVDNYEDSSCIVELRDRVQALEAAQPLRTFTAAEVAPIVVPTAEPAAKPTPAEYRVRELQHRIRDGSLTLAEALEEIGVPVPAAAEPEYFTLAMRVGCLVAIFASEGRPGDDAVPTARKILRRIADHLRCDHPNYVGRGTDWADYFDAEADD